MQGPPPNRIRCQLCDKLGHYVRVCRSRSHYHFEEKANFASRSQSNATPWIVDSGASHHIINDANNFQPIHDITCPEEITVGYDNSVPIPHTGSTKLRASNHNFNLTNTLCAPAIKTNLLSVNFFNDNFTSIEFFPSDFCIKDLDTGTI